MKSCDNCSIKAISENWTGPTGIRGLVTELALCARREEDPDCLACIGERKVSALGRLGKLRRDGVREVMSPHQKDAARGRRISRKRGARNTN